MPISFSQIPAEIKVPLYWVEVDPSMAGLPVLQQPALLVGTKIVAGSAPADIALAIGSQAQADEAFGQGSELARMFRAFYDNNTSGIVYGLPVDEPVGGAAATGTIKVTTGPTDAGTIHLYIGGTHVPVNVGSTDTVNDVHTAISFAINDNPDLPVTAVGGPSDVTITAVWKGVGGNDIAVGMNYQGTIGGEITPPGLALTLPVTGMLTGGVGVPVFDDAIDNLGEKEFEYVALPFTDATSLDAWENEYGFSDDGRWGWQRQLFGHVFSAKRDTYPNLITFGNSRNSGVISVLSVEMDSPSPAFEWAAAYTGKAQRALLNDLVPQATVIAVLVNPNNLNAGSETSDAQEAARVLGLEIQVLRAGSDRDLETAFATLAQVRAGALLVTGDAFFTSRLDQLIALAARHAVPAMHTTSFARAGGLMSYNTNDTERYRQVGSYTGRILKGEKPADLPVVQPTRFELVFNLKTAKAA